jgi:hypothetical protein
MIKPLTTLVAAGAVAAATLSNPTPAHAIAEWVIPAIIIAGVGGAVVGATAQHNATAGTVYVQPRAQARCQIVRERLPNGNFRRVEVCN